MTKLLYQKIKPMSALNKNTLIEGSFMLGSQGNKDKRFEERWSWSLGHPWSCQGGEHDRQPAVIEHPKWSCQHSQGSPTEKSFKYFLMKGLWCIKKKNWTEMWA